MPKKPRLVPSIEDLTILHAFYQRVKDSPHLSLRDIAPKIGWSPTAIWECLNKLEKLYGVRLFDRRQGGRYRVNDGGRFLYERAKRFLQDYDGLRQWVSEGQTKVTVGCTRTLLAHTLPGAVARFMSDARWKGKVTLQFLENEYPQILEDLHAGRVDFGLGPELPQESYRKIKIGVLEPAMDVVLICHLDHRFARERRSKVPLRELASELVFVMGADVLYDSLPALNRATGGERIEVTTFDSVVAGVRMGIGVGLVPGFYQLLDDLRKRGLLYYAQTDLKRIRTGLYLPPGEEGLSEAANAFLSMLKEHAITLHPKSGWDSAEQPAAFPSNPRGLPHPLREYRYEYYVSSKAPGFATPEWRRGILNLKLKGLKIWGEGQDFWEEDIEVFKVEGRFEKHLLYIVGGRQGESYVATYNTLGKDGTLVGTWTGKDRNGEPISAPILLSPRELQVPDLRSITRMAMLRFIQDAESGFSSDS